MFLPNKNTLSSISGSKVLLLASICSVALLSACSPAHQDLRDWMTKERANARPVVKPISPPKTYVPVAYTEAMALDPFDAERLTQALRRETGPVDAGALLIAAENARRKEPLEDFPLDNMKMVGSIERGSEKVALLNINGLLYQVKAGNYIGQDYGLVRSISESQIMLREVVQDAAGEWIERETVLDLQESSK